jgi:CHAT domain-containing protein
MRVAGAIACLSVLIPIVGSPRRSFDPGKFGSPSYWDTNVFLSIRKRAYEHVRSGKTLDAARAYEAAYREAMRLGDKRSAVRFMNSAAACRMALLQIRETMSALLLTKKMSEEIGDKSMLRISTLNLSPIYLQLGDLEAAGFAAGQGLEGLAATELPVSRIQALLLLGLIRFRQADMTASEQQFRNAIALAEQTKEITTLGLAWNYLGYVYLSQNQLREAEDALMRGYRILADRDDPETPLCFINMGRLYRMKGDLNQSSKWMERAVKESESGNKRLPGWYVFQERGKLRNLRNMHTAAFTDFQRALQSARQWRLEVVPADSLRVSSEVKLQGIYDEFLSAGYRLYQSRPDQKLQTELFLAAEENRAWSLRQSLREGSNRTLPDEYYALLAELRSADSKILSGRASETLSNRFASLRHRLKELEAAAGLQNAAELLAEDEERLPVRSIQVNLLADEALLSFHVSGDPPLLFTLTRERLTMHQLPSRPVVEAAVLSLRAAIDQRSPQLEAIAAHAYQTLLGALPEEVKAKRHWLLALDVGLFDLPFAVLRSGNSYLIERHSLTVTPHVAMRNRQRKAERIESFLGFGDPVYNRADPRWKAPRQIFGDLWASRPAFELPRLAGSGRELERCGRLFNSDAVLVEGTEATAERLNSELRRSPMVIHLAAHVVPSGADPTQALIALSLKPDGTSSLLSRDSIAALRTNAALVIMSGCGSGLGPVLPGAGLMGLTRAWMEAGAHSVVASLWPVRDDNGDLLFDFYKALREKNTSASDALQTAQLESLRSASWRADPRYWASYFVTGKD